ncbi:hypothetical protein, partial [Salmonella enterica]|uniref:hypothetical protein n=1 Tax=Salmonella enterica TaxID=28901 RepID=UPI003D315BB5
MNIREHSCYALPGFFLHYLAGAELPGVNIRFFYSAGISPAGTFSSCRGTSQIMMRWPSRS